MAAERPAFPSQSTEESQESQKSTVLTDLQTRRSALESQLSALTAQRNSLASTILFTTNALNLDQAAHACTSRSEVLSQDIEQKDIDQALRTARSVMKDHIALLQRYNEIKDIGQGLLGLIAEQRGCRIVDVMEELGVEDD